METTACDSKIIVGGKLRAGWQMHKGGSQSLCLPLSELSDGDSVFLNSDFTRMERAHKEALEEYGRACRRLLSVDEDEAFCRDVMVYTDFL
ncbi:hypothetical protein FNV43_RR14278 [Rhamnella rubrinervis]|uniref:Uncharacterized protein n=1 Tax=Rhamnella rubrinervis TaxID=2594499 RepID=A0A8K0H2J5_9ROSA|nr:hypothetical protein FNV43_RR14278 [Rhamnella rubrinervis]